jgi:hypothetical protein
MAAIPSTWISAIYSRVKLSELQFDFAQSKRRATTHGSSALVEQQQKL